MSMPIQLHCRVAPFFAEPGKYVIASARLAELLGLPTGLLNIVVLFHSEKEMQVWQDQAQSDPKLMAALSP